jgi:hypothetical protein
MKDLYIETASGVDFYIDSSPFDIKDIAAALSKLCRFNGHCERFYSVAQHSILVSDLMHNLELGDPFEGLMHDATEAYLADIPSPWKVLLPEYKALESRLDARLRQQFRLPAKITEGCKKADYIALYIEAEDLIKSKGEKWPAPPGIKEAAVAYQRDFPLPWEHGRPNRADVNFLFHFNALTRDRSTI